MLSCIFSAVKTIMLGILMNEYLKTKHPIIYSNIARSLLCISGSLFYSSIYIYSLVQLKYIQFNNVLKNKLQILHCFDSNITHINDNIQFVFDGKIIKKTNKEEILGKTAKELDLKYDFFIYLNNLNRRIIKYDDTNKFNEDTFVCQPADFKFISSEIIFENENTRINIDFKVNNYSYYVVNNTFDKNFLWFFMCEYYWDEIKHLRKEDFIKYQIEILDQNVNKDTFNALNTIKINKTDYEKIYN